MGWGIRVWSIANRLYLLLPSFARITGLRRSLSFVWVHLRARHCSGGARGLDEALQVPSSWRLQTIQSYLHGMKWIKQGSKDKTLRIFE